MENNCRLRHDAAGALAAGEEFFVSVYLVLRVCMFTGVAFTPQEPFLRSLLLMAAGLLVIRRAVAPEALRRDDGGLFFPLGLYFAGLAAASIHSEHPSASWDKVVYGVEMLLVIIIVSDGAQLTPGRRRRIIGIICSASVVALIHALQQRFWGLSDTAARVAGSGDTAFNSPWGRERLLSRQPFAAFTTSNLLGGYLVFVLPLWGAAAVAGWKKSKRAAAAAGTLVLLGLLVVFWTRARGAWAGAAAGGIFTAGAFTLRRVRTAFWTLWAAGGAAAIALACISPPCSSMGIRAGYWLGGLRAMLKYPLGFGPGAFAVVYPRFRPVWGMESRAPHNIYLNALFGGGIVLLIAFVFLLYRFFRCAASEQNAASAIDTTDDGNTPRPVVKILHYFAPFVAVIVAGVVFRELTFDGVLHAVYGGERGVPVIAGIAAYVLTAAAGPLAALLAAACFMGAPRSVVRAGFLAGLLAFMVHGWVEFLWDAPAIPVTLAACAWAVSEEKTPMGKAPSEARPSFLFHTAVAAICALVLGAAFVFVSVSPIKSAAALQRADIVIKPHVRNIGRDALALESALERFDAGETAAAASLLRSHAFASGIFADGVEKNTAAEALSRGDARPLRELLFRTGAVIEEYGRDMDASLFRFLAARPGDDRAILKAASINQELAAAGVERSRRLAEADAFLLDAIRLAPSSASAWGAAAEIALDTGDYTAAHERHQEALKRSPASPLRCLAAGDAALLAGEYFLAADFYRRALELNAATVEIQASLFTLAVYPDIVRKRRESVESDIDDALYAAVSVLARETFLDVLSYPFLFRTALRDIAAGRVSDADDGFRLLDKAYGGEFSQTFLLFRALIAARSGAANASDFETLIEDPVALCLLGRLKRAFELAGRRL
ncbi:MAG TPA: hypothetical protein ENN09_01775 [Planctomycetes bacterium]|nr:hypothetical protein [Planctomycetota bacterium]